jgi:isoleucyl-tRNA synthetase
LDGTRHTLEEGDLEVGQEAAGNLVVKGEGAFTVALDPEVDDELRAEGVARELVNRIQRLRRDAGLEITDRIELGIGGPEVIRAAAGDHLDFICGETLARRVGVVEEISEGDFPNLREVDIDGTPVWIGLRPSGA